MAYKPNFGDPRVRRRITRAVGWARGCLSESTPQGWSTRYIDRYLGHASDNLSRWLRAHLLVVMDDYYSHQDGICKRYCLHANGCRWIQQLLGGTTTADSLAEWARHDRLRRNTELAGLLEPGECAATTSTPPDNGVQLVVQLCSSEWQRELQTGQFQYVEKSNRLWHPLQRVRKTYKGHIFHLYDFGHQYDIVACAPTLVHEYAIGCGMDLYLFALRDYLRDRSTHRRRIATELGISVESAKAIINALFAGARLSCNRNTDLYELVNYDPGRMRWLQEDSWLCELRSDIRTCWQYIVEARPDLRRRHKNRYLPLTATNKWGLYFYLERQVLNAVREYLDMTRNRYFLEHDGWNCRQPVHIGDLVSWVRYRTGYHICIEKKSCYDLSVVNCVAGAPHITTDSSYKYFLEPGIQSLSHTLV